MLRLVPAHPSEHTWAGSPLSTLQLPYLERINCHSRHYEKPATRRENIFNPNKKQLSPRHVRSWRTSLLLGHQAFAACLLRGQEAGAGASRCCVPRRLSLILSQGLRPSRHTGTNTDLYPRVALQKSHTDLRAREEDSRTAPCSSLTGSGSRVKTFTSLRRKAGLTFGL